MAQVCLPAGCVDAIRAALVDECSDSPLAGESNGYVFNCFRNLTITKNIEDGDETVLKNDCGRKCWQTKKCDELKDINIEFELLNPDYELIALLTGQPLVNNGDENIGWYQKEGDNCFPWVSLELFEQVPDESCAADHKYRRLVFPKVRFKLPTDEKEDPFRLVKLEARTSPAEIANWGTGPFDDSPFDFSVVDAGVQSHYMEFFDDSITDTLAGQCGYIEVPADGGGGGQAEIQYVSSSVPNEITIEGVNLSGLGTVRVFYNGGESYIDFAYPAGGPSSVTLTDILLAGETVTQINTYSDNPASTLIQSYTASPLPLAMGDFSFYFSYDSGLDQLTIDTTLAIDFNVIDAINYQSNGTGQLLPANWTVNSATQMVINSAAVVLNGGDVEELVFLSGMSTIANWNFNNIGAGYPIGAIDLV